MVKEDCKENAQIRALVKILEKALDRQHWTGRVVVKEVRDPKFPVRQADNLCGVGESRPRDATMRLSGPHSCNYVYKSPHGGDCWGFILR